MEQQDSKLLKGFFMQQNSFVSYPTFRKYSILDCSRVAGIYNSGEISISYEDGDLEVHIHRSSIKKITGKVKPSCEGYIVFDDNEQETFEFNEEDKEIVWYGDHSRDKWKQGQFCCIILNLFIRFEYERR